MPPDFSPEATEDADCMAAVARGDSGAFEKLYERHSATLYGVCLKVLRRPADAQAVLSDVFFEVWQKPSRFNPQRGCVRSYLIVLARSRSIDRLRADSTRLAYEKGSQQDSARTVGGGPSGQPAGPEATAIAGEERRLVRGALGELPDTQRRALELAYFGGLSHREIATELDIPLGTAKTHIRTGLKKLRGILSSQGGA